VVPLQQTAKCARAEVRGGGIAISLSAVRPVSHRSMAVLTLSMAKREMDLSACLWRRVPKGK